MGWNGPRTRLHLLQKYCSVLNTPPSTDFHFIQGHSLCSHGHMSSPVQLPAASSIKPAVHVVDWEHWKEPGVLMQNWSTPQLWVPKTHSSMSATDKEKQSAQFFPSWVRKTSTFFLLMLPWHASDWNSYPDPHLACLLHMKDPSVLMHTRSPKQLSVPARHSSISEEKTRESTKQQPSTAAVPYPRAE